MHGQGDDRTGRVLDTLARGERMRQPKNLIRIYANVSDLAASVIERPRLSLQGIFHVGAAVPASHYDYATTLAERWNHSATLIEGFVIDSEPSSAKSLHGHKTCVECSETRFSQYFRGAGVWSVRYHRMSYVDA